MIKDFKHFSDLPNSPYTLWPSDRGASPHDSFPFQMKIGSEWELGGVSATLRSRTARGEVVFNAGVMAPIVWSVQRFSAAFYAGLAIEVRPRIFDIGKAPDGGAILSVLSKSALAKYETRRKYLEAVLAEDRRRTATGQVLVPIAGRKDGSRDLPRSPPRNLGELIACVAEANHDDNPPDWRTIAADIGFVRDLGFVHVVLAVDGRSLAAHPKRLSPFVEAIIEAVLISRFMQPDGCTLAHAVASVASIVRIYNKRRREAGKFETLSLTGLEQAELATVAEIARVWQGDLPVPARNTIAARIDEIPGEWIEQVREGRKKSKNVYRCKGIGDICSEPLENVIFDWHLLDIKVRAKIDDSNEVALVKPILGIFLDEYTGLIIAAFVTFRRPSITSYLTALRHFVLPTELCDETASVVYRSDLLSGRPLATLCDRGAELISETTRATSVSLEADALFCAPGQPYQKGEIESAFRRIYLELLQNLPGLTDERGEVRIAAKYCLDEGTFAEKIRSYMFEHWPLTKARTRPMAAGLALRHFQNKNPEWAPSQFASVEEIDRALGIRVFVKATDEGVRYENLVWNGDWIAQIRSDLHAHKRNPRVQIIVMPHDLKSVWVVHPKNPTRIERVPTSMPRYVQNLDLWQHERVMAALKFVQGKHAEATEEKLAEIHMKIFDLSQKRLRHPGGGPQTDARSYLSAGIGPGQGSGNRIVPDDLYPEARSLKAIAPALLARAEDIVEAEVVIEEKTGFDAEDWEALEAQLQGGLGA